jgi:hypothetical protein
MGVLHRNLQFLALAKMKIKTEKAVCAACGKTFVRRAGRSNPKKFCDGEKCQKIKKIKNSVAKFSDLPSPTMSPFRADIQYNGRYME